jgi:proton-translocating NADH-quinone oxidoreductase chain N
MTMFDNDFIALLPEIFLIHVTVLLLIYGVVFSTSKSHHYPPLVRNVAWLGLLAILITIALMVSQPVTNANLCYNHLIMDNFTYFCKIGLLLSTACIILMCLQYFQQDTLNTFESIVLILLSTCSMLFMISAYDLIVMYLAIELQSLCFYVIAASKRNSEFSTEAGLKYFILGAFSSGILLFGCSLIYGFTGVTNLEELAKIFTGSAPVGHLFGPIETQHGGGAFSSSPFGPQSSGVFMGILFLAVGFLFKITAVPFHMWAPDVYEGAPTFVTAFFSVAPKIAILANMLRVFIYSFYDPTWQQLFVFCSIGSMVVGAIAALAQNKVKRLLAYSSIGHVGYLLIGLACGTIEGIQSLLIGLFIYVLMTVNAFAVVLALRQNRIKYLSDLGALAKTNPILALTLSVTMFSYAGIPPLAGFCSKFYLFFAALGCGAYLLALLGVLTSVISCFYYIRFVKIMYFDTPSTWISYKPMDREKSLLLAVTLFCITFFFLYPSPLFLITHQMALSLCL